MYPLTQQLVTTARERFRASGISILELSRRTGLGYATCHGWCAGDRVIEFDSFVRIVESLGLDIRLVTRKG